MSPAWPWTNYNRSSCVKVLKSVEQAFDFKLFEIGQQCASYSRSSIVEIMEAIGCILVSSNLEQINRGRSKIDCPKSRSREPLLTGCVQWSSSLSHLYIYQASTTYSSVRSEDIIVEVETQIHNTTQNPKPNRPD